MALHLAAKAPRRVKTGALVNGQKLSRAEAFFHCCKAYKPPVFGSQSVPAHCCCVWYMTHHIPEKSRRLHLVFTSSGPQSTAGQMPQSCLDATSRRSKLAAASCLMFSCSRAVSEVGPTNSMRLKSWPKIAVLILQRKPARTPPLQLKSREVLRLMQSVQRPRMHAYRPIQERILDAALHVKYGCGVHQRRQFPADTARREEEDSGMRLEPSGVVVVWTYHDVVLPPKLWCQSEHTGTF